MLPDSIPGALGDIDSHQKLYIPDMNNHGHFSILYSFDCRKEIFTCGPRADILSHIFLLHILSDSIWSQTSGQSTRS